ncbi:hypothetical protein DAEQUDRAFT_762516 [Daedalea quercina L-15889]|uniref:Uncharacterized protein n=1 Tax=Daedalea quercina L-15889 TaxID=1314783 RepID=A0A165TAV2_9APHY|nr:hypothetical protein DAEQUDRAFT_762516 [Daedalea quercina L-15889]
MPTVPPTFVPVAPYDDAIPGHAAFPVPGVLDHIDRHDAAPGPTPDPEFDDFTLVPMESGHAVTSTGPSRPPASPSPPRKPRLSLGPLSLHSPSTAIVGTPFDLSPRFEYPFPSLASSTSASAVDPDGLPYAQWPFGAYGHGHVPGWAGFPVSASLSLPSLSAAGSPLALGHPWTLGAAGARRAPHPKLHRGEPPVPPSLAKKRRVVREREAAAAAALSHTDPADRQAARSVRRRTSLDRRESDETVVGSGDGEGREEGEEKVRLVDLEPPLRADEEVTTGESPLVSPGEVGEAPVEPALITQGEVASSAQMQVQAQVLVDTGSAPDVALDAPAPLLSDTGTACTADLCPDFFHTAPDAAAAAAPPQHALEEQIHEPHDNAPALAPPPPGVRGKRPDAHAHAHDGTTNWVPAPIHDGARPPSPLDEQPAPAPAPAPAITTAPMPALPPRDTGPPPASVVDR